MAEVSVESLLNMAGKSLYALFEVITRDPCSYRRLIICEFPGGLGRQNIFSPEHFELTGTDSVQTFQTGFQTGSNGV